MGLVLNTLSPELTRNTFGKGYCKYITHTHTSKQDKGIGLPVCISVIALSVTGIAQNYGDDHALFYFFPSSLWLKQARSNIAVRRTNP